MDYERAVADDVPDHRFGQLQQIVQRVTQEQLPAALLQHLAHLDRACRDAFRQGQLVGNGRDRQSGGDHAQGLVFAVGQCFVQGAVAFAALFVPGFKREPALQQAKSLFGQFIQKAGSSSEFGDASKRAKERMEEIDQIIAFNRQTSTAGPTPCTVPFAVHHAVPPSGHAPSGVIRKPKQ